MTARERRIIIARAGGCCEYCRTRADFSTQAFSVEHITPASRGGETTLENLALSCPGCNGHKYAKTEAPDPVSNKVVPLYDPRKHRWRDHFRWDADCLQIIALTPTGRATIAALQLNRRGVVNIRLALSAIGKHPPAEAPEDESDSS